MENLKRKLDIYERLFSTYGPGTSECQISELAALLHVSERHVQTLLKKMVAVGWIDWVAQSGRNKKARLSCCIEPIEACYEIANPLADSGNVEQLLNVLSFGGRDPQKELEAYLAQSQEAIQRIAYIPFHRELERLHPFSSLRRTERFLVTQICQRLTCIHNGKLEGDLAYQWRSNSSATCWHFQVRSGVHFHDGSLLSAQDVVRCLQTLVSTQCWARLYRHITSVKATSNELIEITLSQADWYLPRLLSRAEASIFKLPSSERLIGSGAFSLDVFSSKMLRLGRNDRYSHSSAILKRVELWVYPDWAKSKSCAVNQVCLQMPDQTQSIESQKLSTFLKILNKEDGTDIGFCSDNLKISSEDTSECQALSFAALNTNGENHKVEVVPYGHYHQDFEQAFCSIIDENDAFISWLSFFCLYPFRSDCFQSDIKGIRSRTNHADALEGLEALKAKAKALGMVVELKQESFNLAVSKKIENARVNGFGWCELGDIWISDLPLEL
ncbi:SgrR family transcriptional regulator [Vibrio penaeicida]|uniref:SgrR family transcriptional regulator n=1 Tax=Vibrio penaeicida TaxID=104609 RepID=UPI00273538A5|nr:SgrR family transcriptional regulator [Vibrio penaeicida]MDP2573477.1 SgrR family transcriptional regulator [Vibrio penaeicida]